EAGFVNGLQRAADRWPKHASDPQAFGQATTDALFHLRPDLPYDHVTDAGSPDYMPDFDHNGVFGDPGDFDHDTDDVLDTAPFLYPCPGEDGSVLYETTSGSCVASGTSGAVFKPGLPQERTVVD